MYKCSKLKCWNILTKKKTIFNELFFISECIYIFITHVSLVRMNQHFMTECFECTFTLMMDFQVGISRSIINIECTNIATRWACLNIPSQWFTSQSDNTKWLIGKTGTLLSFKMLETCLQTISFYGHVWLRRGPNTSLGNNTCSLVKRQ